MPTAAPARDGLVRHALTFTVTPGSEQKVAEILAGYTSPAARVDAITRLYRTSLFMHGNRVVRAVEVIGDLGAALRYVAMQPEVRAVEEAVNPYLEEDRDLGNPESARGFFFRASLPARHHQSQDGPLPEDVDRVALLYPARPGCGEAVARLLARQDQLASTDPAFPFASSTIFQSDDNVVRMVDLRAPLEQEPAMAVGVGGPRKAAMLARLIDLGEDGDLTSEDGLRRFLGDWRMTLVTDRRALDS
jgi:hypothetical protein